jgi:rhodanese-related sulfurtransferase
MKFMLKSLLLIISFLFCHQLLAEESGKYQSPESVEGTETISLEQAKKMHAEGVIFIDVRSPRQYKKRHIAGAVHLYIKDNFSEQNLLKLGQKDTPYILYCNGVHCSLSYKAAEKAVAWGFTNIKYYRDGFRAWRLDGNPIEYGMVQDKG